MKEGGLYIADQGQLNTGLKLLNCDGSWKACKDTHSCISGSYDVTAMDVAEGNIFFLKKYTFNEENYKSLQTLWTPPYFF